MPKDHQFLPSPLALQDVATYPIPAFDRSEYLRLDINERPDGAPSYVVDALRAALQPQQIATYPTYTEWAALASAAFGVPTDHIVATNGADEGIRAIIDAHLMPGTALITHRPGFEMFSLAARLKGNPVVDVPFAVERPALFRFDEQQWFKALSAAAPRPGVVTIANPSNPTGAMVPRESIERTLQTVDCPVILDETYGAFLGQTCVDLVDTHPHLFVLRSFSKVHGLAGLRIGAVISQPQNIAALRRVLNPYNVNRAAVAASIACMRHPEDTRSHVTEVCQTRDAFAAAMNRLHLPTGAQHANFLLVHVGEKHKKITDALRDEGVLIRDRHGSHPALDGVVRVAIGTPGQMARVAGSFRKHLQRPPRLDTLLLDMDGTLVDVRASYRRAIRETARDLLAEGGVDAATLEKIDDACVDAFKAKGGLNNDWDCTLAICQAHGATPTKEDVIAAFQKRYRGTAFDGFIANERWLLDASAASLMTSNVAVGIVTGRPRAEAEWTLRRYHAGLARELVAMEDTVADKPDPEPLWRGQRLLGGDNAAYVGDSVDDMAAAHAAGMFAVGVLAPGCGWRSGWPERLHLAGANVIFEDINAAIQWLFDGSEQ